MTIINRREILGAAAGTVAFAAPSRGVVSPGGPFDAERLMADVKRYADFGIQQTGSPGGIATGKWVAARLSAAGFAVSSLPIEVPFFDQQEAMLKAGDLRLSGFAQHPVVPTGKQGLTAPLAMRYDKTDDAALAGRIAVIPLPYGRHSAAMSPVIEPLLVAAKRSGAVGIILITTGPTALPIALNAAPEAPFAGIPILSIGLDKAPALIDLARAGTSATMVIDGEIGRRQGDNIVARRPGSGPKVVVTTPLSGWFRCAGERGSGVAAWLAFAGWLPKAFPRHDLTFAGLVGHEFENIGSKLFMANAAPPPESVALWHHFGSGFAVRDWHEATPGKLTPLDSADPQRYLLATPAMLPVIQRATRNLPGIAKVYPASAQTAAGEATAILKAGYANVIANFAGHRFHHVEADGPETTSGDLIAASARALRVAVQSILTPA